MGNYRPGRVISLTRKVMEHIILKNLSKHKSKKVPGNIQQGFEKRKMMLELIVFCNETEEQRMLS